MTVKILSTLFFITVLVWCASAVAQDPVPLYPNNYKILLENDRVRVMDFRLRKGDTEDFHSHPAHVLYVLEPFKIKFSFPDGRTGMRETKAGEVLFSEAVTHSPVNIGGTDAHGILVELKGAAAKPTSQQMSDNVLTAVTFIQGLPGKEEELKNELLSLAGPTRAEAGCILYDLYQSPVKKNEFMRLELWRTPEALEEHKSTPHIQASFKKRQEQGWTTNITVWKRVAEDLVASQ